MLHYTSCKHHVPARNTFHVVVATNKEFALCINIH